MSSLIPPSFSSSPILSLKFLLLLLLFLLESSFLLFLYKNSSVSSLCMLFLIVCIDILQRYFIHIAIGTDNHHRFLFRQIEQRLRWLYSSLWKYLRVLINQCAGLCHSQYSFPRFLHKIDSDTSKDFLTDDFASDKFQCCAKIDNNPTTKHNNDRPSTPKLAHLCPKYNSFKIVEIDQPSNSLSFEWWWWGRCQTPILRNTPPPGHQIHIFLIFSYEECIWPWRH